MFEYNKSSRVLLFCLLFGIVNVVEIHKNIVEKDPDGIYIPLERALFSNLIIRT